MMNKKELLQKLAEADVVSIPVWFTNSLGKLDFEYLNIDKATLMLQIELDDDRDYYVDLWGYGGNTRTGYGRKQVWFECPVSPDELS